METTQQDTRSRALFAQIEAGRLRHNELVRLAQYSLSRAGYSGSSIHIAIDGKTLCGQPALGEYLFPLDRVSCRHCYKAAKKARVI